MRIDKSPVTQESVHQAPLHHFNFSLRPAFRKELVLEPGHSKELISD